MRAYAVVSDRGAFVIEESDTEGQTPGSRVRANDVRERNRRRARPAASRMTCTRGASSRPTTSVRVYPTYTSSGTLIRIREVRLGNASASIIFSDADGARGRADCDREIYSRVRIGILYTGRGVRRGEGRRFFVSAQ